MSLPIRVRVSNGDQSEALGEGNYVGEATVFFYQGHDEDGDIRIISARDAGQELPPEDIPEGYELIISEGNPKIVLDSGEVVYGCQVWWEPVDKADWPILMKRLQ